MGKWSSRINKEFKGRVKLNEKKHSEELTLRNYEKLMK